MIWVRHKKGLLACDGFSVSDNTKNNMGFSLRAHNCKDWQESFVELGRFESEEDAQKSLDDICFAIESETKIYGWTQRRCAIVNSSESTSPAADDGWW